MNSPPNGPLTTVQQLGTMVVMWGILEFSMALMFAGLLGAPFSRRISVFYGVVSNQSRIDMLKMALTASSYPADAKEDALKLINKFQALNKTRNKYVHSLYNIDEVGTPKLLDCTKPGYRNGVFVVGIQRDLNPVEIQNHCLAAEQLSERVCDFSETKLGIPSSLIRHPEQP